MTDCGLPCDAKLRIALHLSLMHHLECVDRRWRLCVLAAKRLVRQMFGWSHFSVECLGDLGVSARNLSTRLNRLYSRLSSPVEELEETTKFWYEAQLHLGIFCNKYNSSFIDIFIRCFDHSSFCGYNFEQLFPSRAKPWLSTNIDVRNRESAFEVDTERPINHRLFDYLGFVCSRDLGCGKLGCSVGEVLATSWSMMAGDSYCPFFCGCRGDDESPE